MFRKARKTRVGKEEIIADFIFLAFSFIVTVAALYIFDMLLQDKSIYLWGGLTGAIIGLLLAMLFLFGLKEEEKAWGKRSK